VSDDEVVEKLDEIHSELSFLVVMSFGFSALAFGTLALVLNGDYASAEDHAVLVATAAGIGFIGLALIHFLEFNEPIRGSLTRLRNFARGQSTTGDKVEEVER